MQPRLSDGSGDSEVPIPLHIEDHRMNPDLHTLRYSRFMIKVFCVWTNILPHAERSRCEVFPHAIGIYDVILNLVKNQENNQPNYS